MKRPSFQTATVYTMIAAFLALLAYTKFTSYYPHPLDSRDPLANSLASDAQVSGTDWLSDFGSTGASAQTPVQAATESPPQDQPQLLENVAAQPLSKRVMEYHISVKLDPETKTLKGTQTVTWTNPGFKPVDEMYLHLYANAFESDKTTFMRESGGKHREDARSKNSEGGITVDSIKTADGTQLLGRLQFVQPDDGNTHDHTLAKLKLPAPALPGQPVTLNFQYTVKLPRVFARMGYADNFVMAGQWFPKIAAYELAGTRGRTEEGWDMHQYHGNSEFYSDFGIYTVRIQVPDTYTVAATGHPTKPAAKDGNGLKTYQFYAEDVHDFAWAASPNFVYVEEPFSAPNVPGVKIKLYLDPNHKDLKDRYLLAAKKALARYSEWYGSYPYSTLSIVVPPAGANGAGGMEYPTLITSWGADNKKPDLELERVLVHEIGHQYWYGMVANNEFEEAWLDEGLTSYTEDKLMELEYGTRPNTLLESSYMTSPAPLKLEAWKYSGHSTYAENVYTRAKLVLLAIEKQVGPKKMAQTFKLYFERWKFRHPSTKDFQQVLEQTTGQSWQPFFDQYVYNGLMVDYAIESLHSEPATVDGKPTYNHEVVVRRGGGSFGPLTIRMHFTDGSTLDREWNQTEDRLKFTLTHPGKLDWVMIDPDYRIVLENKHINNYMKAEINETWKVRLNIGTVKLIETLLSWVAW